MCGCGQINQECTFPRNKRNMSMEKFTKLYVKDVVRRHDISLCIGFDIDNCFTLHFLRACKKNYKSKYEYYLPSPTQMVKVKG